MNYNHCDLIVCIYTVCIYLAKFDFLDLSIIMDNFAIMEQVQLGTYEVA